MIELKQNSILIDGAERGSLVEYHISNGESLRRATELELDVVEPSIICHNNLLMNRQSLEKLLLEG